VTEDLFKKGLTTSSRTGFIGGSNGGLLAGVAYTQRPDLFKAIISQVPLLDMKRYHKLLAGASWTAEYGNPDDPKDWDYISKYSPYQNIKSETQYPSMFLMTSTRDDRVHPGHARKFAAKLQEMKIPFYYFENTEGGHGAAADLKQRARYVALQYAYFLEQLQ
jgi:prolyl oligopeptidase